MSPGYFELLLSFLSQNTKNTSAAQAIKNVSVMAPANTTNTLPRARRSTCNARGANCFSVRGTSGDLRHPRQSRYRCSLPGLAGFAGPRCTEPEVPRSGSSAVRAAAKKSLAYSAGVEMRRKFLNRNVTKRLSVNAGQCSAIQLAVIRNGKRLPSAVGSDPAQLNVTAALRLHSEPKRRKNLNNVRARQNLRFRDALAVQARARSSLE